MSQVASRSEFLQKIERRYDERTIAGKTYVAQSVTERELQKVLVHEGVDQSLYKAMVIVICLVDGDPTEDPSKGNQLLREADCEFIATEMDGALVTALAEFCLTHISAGMTPGEAKKNLRAIPGEDSPTDSPEKLAG